MTKDITRSSHLDEMQGADEKRTEPYNGTVKGASQDGNAAARQEPAAQQPVAADRPAVDGRVHAMRHSTAHVLAAAIQKLWPEARFGVGPVVENGFYYDIDIPGTTISADQFGKIEKAMREVIKADHPFVRSEKPIEGAVQWARDGGQTYKEELLNDLQRAGTTVAGELDAEELGVAASGESAVETVSFYTCGDFTDLCRGPHVESTGKVGAFKLMKVAGAYWRGREGNPQMQRLYGVAFETQQQLEAHLTMLEEAKLRDHRRLGQELDLFTFSDLVGPGLPLYTPRGTAMMNEIKGALNDISQRYDMLPVSIPHLAKRELYEASGHAAKFSDELFTVQSHYDAEFVLKPVNCPHHTQIYASRQRSYRDLPLRYVEQTMQYRDEKPGQIGGLQRTRGFTVDDGHTFCRVDQIAGEATMIANVVREFYQGLGLWGKHWVSLSVRDPRTPEAYIGEPADWERAEVMLAEMAEQQGLDAKRMEGEAALYGPKLDFMFQDALGRETQLATIQLDFAMPGRFGLSYTDSEGKAVVPVMIHRAILGSFERFMMLIIEHFAGKFPVWLAPEQLRIIQVNSTSEVATYAESLRLLARDAGLRVTVDDSNESVGKKIRNAETLKVPYSVVVGDKEVETNMPTPRIRGDLAVEGREPSALEAQHLLNSIANEARGRAMKSSV